MVSTGFVVAAPVGAHTTLIEACPDRGEVVSEIDRIEMVFGSPLIATPEQPPLISLSSGDGETSIEIGPTQKLGDFTLIADLPADLAPGRYIARYLVLSIDGDLNDGGYQFIFDPDAATATNCGLEIDDGSTSGGFILLGVGGVAVLGLAFFLWPRGRGDDDVAGSSS